MPIISIASLTSSALNNGNFQKTLPEYYALQQVTENGAWHRQQNCFDHVIKVFHSYENILEFAFLTPDEKQKVRAYLDRPADKHTRKELLTLTVLLHDIAKTETLIVHPDGSANCPGHELIGAIRTHHFSDRFGLTDIESDHLERMVRYHGFVSDIVARIQETGDSVANCALFDATVGDLALDLMLFIYADLQGCDLDKSKPELYAAYERIQQEAIRHYLSLL